MPNSELVSAVVAAGLQARVAALLDDATLKKIAAAIQEAQPTPDATMGGIGGLIAKTAKPKTYMSEGGTVGQLATLAERMAAKYGPAFGNMRTVAAAFVEAKRKDRGLSLAKFSERVSK